MKKEELYPIQFLSNIQYRLVDCIFGNNLHYVIQSSAICMDVEVDRLGKIQAEDTHDGFCIDHILPDTKSKSQSNLLISFTNAFTLSMEFSEILAVFIIITSLDKFCCFTAFILPVSTQKVKVKRDKNCFNN